MQYENLGRSGRVSTHQLCCRGNGSPNSQETLQLLKKTKEMGFSELFLSGSFHHLDCALNILSWAGLAGSDCWLPNEDRTACVVHLV